MQVYMTEKILRLRQQWQTVLEGEPWYGPAVYHVLEEVDPAKAFQKPGGQAHSLIELLYHMLAWTEFAKAQLDKHAFVPDMDTLDWRQIDPAQQSWAAGLAQFKRAHEKIFSRLDQLQDGDLDQMVDGKPYTKRTLIQGLIQHHVYHAGQIALLHRLLC